jgi:hypothetical protein
LQLIGEDVRGEPGFRCHLLTPPRIHEQQDRHRLYERSAYLLSSFVAWLRRNLMDLPLYLWSVTHRRILSQGHRILPHLLH